MRRLFHRRKGDKAGARSGSPVRQVAAASAASTPRSFPTGIKLLHDAANSTVDLVFVHGLTGDRERTWTADGASEPWPQALLPSELPTARVLTFGYDACVADWRGVVSQNRIADHAWNLLTSLARFRERDDTSERPILFVCHSLGGLVCEDALVTARTRSEPHLQSILRLTRGIAFLGTPHHGAGLARWAELLARHIGAVKQTNSEILAVLRRDSEVLARIQDQFHTMVMTRAKEETELIEICCFYEELPLPGAGLVVARDSAILPGYIPIGIRDTHVGMTKFAAQEEEGFVAISGELRRWIKGLANPDARLAEERTKRTTPGLESLGRAVAIDDNAIRQIGQPATVSEPLNTTTLALPVQQGRLRRPATRGHFEIAIICALTLEANAVDALFDRYWDEDGPPYDKAPGDPNAYSTGLIGRHNVVLAHMPGMGKANAAAVAANCRNSFPNIRLALVVGICGVVPLSPQGDERVLGDVIISSGVVQHDLGRQFPDRFERKDTLLDSLGRPNTEIRSLLAKLGGRRDRKLLQKKIADYLNDIQKEPDLCAIYPGLAQDILFDRAYRHIDDGKSCADCGCNGVLVQRDHLKQANPQPAVHFGLMASGDTVLKSGEHRDSIAQQAGVIGFEMESAGVWDNFPCVVIKAACDYADSHKSKVWQPYAAATAAACAKAFLDFWVPSPPGPQSTRDEPTSPWFLVPYAKNDNFVGRAAALEALQRQPHKPHSQARVALFGLGGIGKTQIALEYAYWLREKHPDMSVFWVHGGTAARFRESFGSIARECKFPGYDDPKANVLSLVKGWLQRKEHGDWVMIIDNADDADVFFPRPQPGKVDAGQDQLLGRYIPECAHGSILVTTRNKQVGVKFTKGKPPVEIKAMDDSESDQLLRPYLSDAEATPAELATLCSRLEHLPLALVQAAAFMEQESIDVDSYLRLLDEGDQSLIERLSEEFEPVGRDSDMPQAVAATWVLSFEQIQRQTPFAGKLLSLMSLFDRQAIPQAFLSDFAMHQPETAQQGAGPIIKALGVLKAFSLVTEEKSRGVDMHRLVQLITRKWLVDKGTMDEFAGQALCTVSNCYPDGREFENQVQCRAYLPHAQKVLEQAGRQSEEEQKAEAYLLCNVAGLFDLEGKWKQAEIFLVRAEKIEMEVFGADHPSTLASLGNLASTYRNQGRWKEAESLFMRVIETSSTVLGPDHPDTLTSIANLASTYRNQGRWKEAESLFMRVIETRKTVLGTDHPDTLTSIANLASTYHHQGRWNEAESLFVRVIETSLTVLGPDHPDTLTSIANLASTYWNQGRWKESESLFVRVIETSSTVLGPDHPDTLTSMANLASTYRSQGRWKEAESLDVRVIETRKTVLGPDYPSTLTSIANLASTYYYQGRWKEAESLFMRVMETRKTVLGTDHPDTLTSMANLAHTWMSQGLTTEALGLMDECAQARNRVLGAKHPHTQLSFDTLHDWRAA